MIKKNGYTIVEISIVVIALSIFLSIFVNVNLKKDSNSIKKVISSVGKYTNATNEFKRKYGFLPGDIKKTQIFELSETNTDGNENNLIEDLNQKNGINSKNIKLDGEVANFWLHLFKSGFVDENERVFPYLDYLKTGILIFSSNGDNYFHLAVNGVNKNKEIETIENLTPYQAYQIDYKLDDGFPTTGDLLVFSNHFINNSVKQIPNKKCFLQNEYLTSNKQKTCQIILRIDI